MKVSVGILRRLLLVPVLMSVYCGCQNGLDIPVDTTDISFSATVNGTKSGIVESDASGLPLADVTGIQLVRGTDGAAPKFNEVPSLSITGSIRKGSSTITPSPSQHYPLNANGVPLDRDVNFLAVYPLPQSYHQGSGSTSASVVWDITDGKTDVMYSAPAKANYYGRSSGSDINFQFNHALARLRIQIKANDYASYVTFRSLVSARIKVPTSARMSFDAQGSSSFTFESENYVEICDAGQKLVLKDPLVEPGVVSSGYVEALVAPNQAATSYKMMFGFEGLGLVDKEYTVNDLRLEPGKTTVLTVTLSGGVIMFMTPYVLPFVDVPVDEGIVIE